MPLTPHSAPPLEASLDAARLQLIGLLDRLTTGLEGTTATAVPGLFIHRILHPSGPKHSVQTPAFALIAQGAKSIFVGEEVYEYDSLNYLLSSVHLPICGKVSVASPDRPYLGLRLELDLEVISDLIRHLPPDTPPASGAVPACGAMCVRRLDLPLLDAVLRLLRLLDTPHDIAVLAPLVKREIFYRLLGDGDGARLRQIALQDSQTQRIAKAIRRLREQYDQPLSIEAIARDAHMSPSSLHHHFKAVTAMSPLQYQKQLRLQEARRLLFLDELDVSVVALRVGYESASQFSREYSRFFGTAPSRDKRRWLARGGEVDHSNAA